MSRKEIIDSIIKRLLSCKDGEAITEIYAKNGSIVRGEFTDWVGLMIETRPESENESLYDLINDIDEEDYEFTLVISVEPDTVERGQGTVLYKKGENA